MDRSTSTGFSEREFPAVRSFLLSSSVPLIYEIDEASGIRGTGCLFEVANRLYLVTAAHVLRGIKAEGVGVPLRAVDGEVMSLGPGVVSWPAQEEYDIAVYRIDNPVVIERLRASFTLLTPRNVLLDLPGTWRFVVAGYPEVTVPKVNNVFRPPDLTQVYTARYEGLTDGTSTPFDFFLKFSYNASGLFDQEKQTPKLEGISGAPVWAVNTDAGAAIWTPETSLRLVGVQISYKHDTYIRAQSWRLVQEMIANLDASRTVGSHGSRHA